MLSLVRCLAPALATAFFLTSALGCSSSAIVRQDDPVFARAEARLTDTIVKLHAQGAPAAETTLMIQAESLYRYRFAPPGRGFGSYAAEFAAAATELPVFQAMSGSLDIYDLRLRAPDGAVQLWESYLARYPGGAFRPLALYRLGWAYRSVAAAGLPRGSGDEAFAQLRREAPGSPLVAFADAAKDLNWKSKDAAAAWSLVPGLGQMYVHRYGAGSVFLLIAAAAAAMTITPVAVAYDRRHDLTWGHDWPLLAVGVGGLLVLSLDYTAAYQSAVARVVEWNDRLEESFEDAHPDAP